MTRVDHEDPILTTREAAQLLGVAVSTTQAWMEGGALPTWKTPGGHRRVRRSAVLQLLRQHVQASSMTGVDIHALSGEFLPGASVAYPTPSNEAQRLATLSASQLMDTPPEAVFDRVTWLASHVSECPMALLTLLSGQRQWFKSRIGVEARETPRELAFCSHTIMQDGPFVVEDASADPRFADNALVTGAPHIRFYAGYPVLAANGMALGSLCVLYSEPRRLRERELRALGELAAIASDEVSRRS